MTPRARLVVFLVGGALLAYDAGLWATAIRSGFWVPPFGADLDLYRDAAVRWFETGVWFQPYQLAGPYETWNAYPMPILYPPTTIPFFLAWAVLPSFLFWAVPIVGTFAIVARYRPSWQVWTVVAGCALFPTTASSTWTGNGTLWIAFVVALATIRPAFGPLVMLKPTLAPFALVGIRSRSYWVAAIALAAFSVAWGPLLVDWFVAIVNGRGNGGVLYSVWQFPMVAIPVVAWVAGRARRADDAAVPLVLARSAR